MRNAFRSSAIVAGAALAVALGFAQSAQAATIELMNDPTRYTVTNQSPIGGEFGVNMFNFAGLSPPAMGTGMAGPQSLFQTFCLELDEDVASHNNQNQDIAFNGPHTLYDFSLDTAAQRGGRNTKSGDPISAATAYLYTQFWYGNLSNYTKAFGAQRASDARELQFAIWYLENELGDSTNGYNPGLGALGGKTLAWVIEAQTAVATFWGNTIGSVRVLNLTVQGDPAQFAQSVLVLVPLPPAAWLGFGLMAAIGAVGVIRRRKQQALV